MCHPRAREMKLSIVPGYISISDFVGRGLAHKPFQPEDCSSPPKSYPREEIVPSTSSFSNALFGDDPDSDSSFLE